MGIADLSSVVNIFGGKEPSPEERQQLFKEVLLMTLSRASSADANIDPCEIGTIQRIINDTLGEEVSEADIRVAANSHLYEKAPLPKYLATTGKKLDTGSRSTVARCLADVIMSDTRVSVLEVDFFNDVANALDLTPAELIGMTAKGE